MGRSSAPAATDTEEEEARGPFRVQESQINDILDKTLKVMDESVSALQDEDQSWVCNDSMTQTEINKQGQSQKWTEKSPEPAVREEKSWDNICETKELYNSGTWKEDQFNKSEQLISQLASKAQVQSPAPAVQEEKSWGNICETKELHNSGTGKEEQFNKRDQSSSQFASKDQVSPPTASIKPEVPWEARRGNLSEKEVQNRVKGILNKLPPETNCPKAFDGADSLKEMSPFEKLAQQLDSNRLPLYLLTGSRVVDKILGREMKNQFTKAAFQSAGVDPHPSSCVLQRGWCQDYAGSQVPEDKEEYVYSKTWELGEELENADEIFQEVSRRLEHNPKANCSKLWKLLDAQVEVCRRIQREIAAAGGSYQEIPPRFIR